VCFEIFTLFRNGTDNPELCIRFEAGENKNINIRPNMECFNRAWVTVVFGGVTDLGGFSLR
jgi:hypothetical protein